MIIYKHPKKLTYHCPGDLDSSIKQVTVIGEDKFIYITKFIKKTYSEWNEELKKNVLDTTLYPVGFHKSRIINIKSNQLTLF